VTRIDFYILDDTAESARLLLAARIAEKAMLRDQHVYINTADRTESSTRPTTNIMKSGS
jgi:DNA polymerase IIIc chi subunit